MTESLTEPPPELTIVLPVYNEGEAVEPVLRALSAGVSTPHELVVVYDFDGDTTVPVIARLATEIPGLRGLRNDLGRGVLNAMKAGISVARRAMTGTVVSPSKSYTTTSS
ncbi:MAG TPA: glycosyltransferase, partial [Verrucomicrobiae bacterium]|nr:glycosyltransferase [Verrucomicrobiae bacterium]